MAWLLLILAGVLEVAWAYFLKLSDGFTRLAPAMITIATMTASFALLAVSMKTLPLGTAYTIWTGIGAVGAFLVGLGKRDAHRRRNDAGRRARDDEAVVVTLSLPAASRRWSATRAALSAPRAGPPCRPCAS
jgi:quaternary ammonium compound-resistance protein SugE